MAINNNELQILKTRKLVGAVNDPEDINYQAALDLAKEAEVTYEALMEGATDYINTGEYMHLGTDSPYVGNEFWEHYKYITGITNEESRQFIQGDEQFFRCSC